MLERLKLRKEFLRVARGKCKWATSGLVLQVAPRRKLEQSFRESEECSSDIPNDRMAVIKQRSDLKVGFTVTKKVGNAVVRNRARRRLRAVAEEIMPAQAKAGFDYVLIGRKETGDRDFAKLKGDLIYALKRTNTHKGGMKKAPQTRLGKGEELQNEQTKR